MTSSGCGGVTVLGWILCAPFAMILVLSRPMGAAPAPSGATEDQLKAAYLSNFPLFVEWPESAFRTPSSPVELCLLGRHPLQDELDALAPAKTAKGRPLMVRRIVDREALSGCHLVFIPASEDTYLASILASIQGTPVLTVGETESFGKRGGMVVLSVRKNHLRFGVNLGAVERTELKISSKLLRLADVVMETP